MTVINEFWGRAMLYTYQVVTFAPEQAPAVQSVDDPEQVHNALDMALAGGYNLLITRQTIRTAAEKDIDEFARTTGERLRRLPPEELATTGAVLEALSSLVRSNAAGGQNGE